MAESLLSSPIVWLFAAGGLVLGLLLGRALAGRGARRDAERARELEDKLARIEEDHARYRAQVSGHFTETSRRLRDLTLQYKSVYEHLADGARTLCPEGAVAIAPSLAEAALPANASGAGEAAATQDTSADDDAQLDLELEPLLDEEIPPPPPPDLSRFR